MPDKKTVEKSDMIPKIMVIGGHQRSGTTLLARLCNSHPDIVMTFEFRSFARLNTSCRKYFKSLRKDWYQRRLVKRNRRESQFSVRLNSGFFLLRYLLELQYHRRGSIDLKTVTNILHRIFPSAAVIGDKDPEYIFQMDQLVRHEKLVRIVIYRDCRDVVRSAIEMSRTDWRKIKIGKRLNTAANIAKFWKRAIEIMEQNAHKIHMIRYEDLVVTPQSTLNDLGCHLGVDPKGFRSGSIHPTSVGRYKQQLSDQDLKDIIRIAGPTMERLGYEV